MKAVEVIDVSLKLNLFLAHWLTPSCQLKNTTSCTVGDFWSLLISDIWISNYAWLFIKIVPHLNPT